MNAFRPISLHMRITSTLQDMMKEALLLQRNSFQAFFILQSTQKHINLSPDAITEVYKLRSKFTGPLIVHGAYWINLASGTDASGISFLKKEIALAERLDFTYYVIHPGTATHCVDRREGMDHLLRRLNYATRRYTRIHFLLENTAHGGVSIGSDLEDFLYIRNRLDFPERVGLCFDTAHAHAAGYSLQTTEDQHELVGLLEQVWGLDALLLLHINDTHETKGSFKDRHAYLGSGTIGLEPLKQFMNHAELKKKSVIIETPPLSIVQQQELLNQLDNW